MRTEADFAPGRYDLVHAHGIYDLEMDTSIATPLECAQTIKAALENEHPRRAFRQLAAQFAGEMTGTNFSAP